MLDSNRTIRSILLLFIAALALLAPGCAGSAPDGFRDAEMRAVVAPDPLAEPSSAAQDLPTRVYAFRGEALVIPVRTPGVIASPIRTVSGEALPTALYRVTRAISPLSPGAWLDDVGGWSAEPRPLGVESGEGGLWMVLVELPENYSGRPLFVGERQLPVMWVPTPPARTDSRFLENFVASGPALRELGDVLRPLRSDPAHRWRVRLLTDRIRADRLWGLGAPSESRIESPVLEALARQTELRYRAAMARVQLADPPLAAELLTALTTIVSLSDGRLLPAWTDATPRMNAILDTALNTARPPARSAEAARNWLGALSPVLPWVIDDGSTVVDGRREATVGVANLTNTAVRTAVAPSGASTSTSASVRPNGAVRLRTEVIVDPPLGPSEPPRARPVIVRTDRPVAQLSIRTPGVGFNPPGFRVPALFGAWTRRGWLSQRAELDPPNERTVALLQASPEGEGWEVYIECRTTDPPMEGSDDRVLVWLGPMGGGDGYLLAGPGAAARLRSASPPPLRLHEWGWSSVVPIPEAFIGADRTLDFAIERITDRGVRTSWPRPMLPEQGEPGRASVRLDPWDPS